MAYGSVLVKGHPWGAAANENGEFQIPKVPAGTYTLVARALGFATSDRAGIRVREDETVSVDFTLAAHVIELSKGLEIVGERKTRDVESVMPHYFPADSAALYGAWRWAQTYGGELAANETPTTGWSRVLYLRHDDTYAFWEQDSIGNFLLCSGEFSVHPCHQNRIEDGPEANLWVQLKGWWGGGWDRDQLVAFVGGNSILTYPGSQTTIVSDALKSRYVRDSSLPIPAGINSPGGGRVYAMHPPRMRKGLLGSYYLELGAPMNELRGSKGQLYQWQDLQFPESVRQSYKYTSNQVPSAVIGDFDGDSSPDAAIYGGTGEWVDSRLLCILSNHGTPRAVTILEEPTILDPPPADTTRNKYRAPHPAFFLSLLHARDVITDDNGRKWWALPTDGILVTRISGEATAYYYSDGEFKKGHARAVKVR